MTTAPTRDMIDRYIAAWNRHDTAAIVEFFADDCYYEDTAFGLICRGKTELRDFCDHSFATMPNMQFVINGTFIEGDGFGWEWTVSGNVANGAALGITASDALVSANGASITRLSGGLIVKNVDYYDSRSFLAQLAG